MGFVIQHICGVVVDLGSLAKHNPVPMLCMCRRKVSFSSQLGNEANLQRSTHGTQELWGCIGASDLALHASPLLS